MARVIEADDAVFSALAYSRPTAQSVAFLSRQFDNLTGALGAAGNRFIERAREAFESYDYEGILSRVDAINRTMTHMWNPDVIDSLFGIGDLQQAKPKMRRWLAASPRFRKEYDRGTISGWRGEYVDMEPGAQGDQCTDYRRVMNGMPVFDEEGNNYFVTYPDVYEEGLEELTLANKENILASWDELAYHLDQRDRDPTDHWNGKL